MTGKHTHTAVVRIGDADSHDSIATAAAHGALSLLTKVSAENRGSVTIKSVSITTPEGVNGAPDLDSLITRSGGKAVVVVAEANAPTSDPEPAS